MNYVYQKQGSFKYEDIIKAYLDFFGLDISPETINRHLRTMSKESKEQLLKRSWSGGRVYFTLLYPISTQIENPNEYFLESENNSVGRDVIQRGKY